MNAHIPSPHGVFFFRSRFVRFLLCFRCDYSVPAIASVRGGEGEQGVVGVVVVKL